MFNTKTVKEELTDCELRAIALTNENAELRMQLDIKKNEEYDKVKQLEAQLDEIRNANKRLTEELCEWKCLECQAEYYGPSAVERGSFRCLTATCKGRYCIPKKYVADTNVLSHNEMVAELEGLINGKKAA